MRKMWGAAASALLLAVPFAPPASARVTGACATEQVILTTLLIRVKPVTGTYRIGQVVKFPITVTRPSNTDPFGQNIVLGEPPVSQPAADVTVGVGVQVGWVYLSGAGVTNENGEALVGVKIESYTKPGTAHARIGAQKITAEAPCATVKEEGAVMIANAFKVTR
ncbi:MAG: hypothetical protein M3345_06245 [Actinomycetota bacterium]|nr:hypothetical protein [Actinomycetota bacterium]